MEQLKIFFLGNPTWQPKSNKEDHYGNSKEILDFSSHISHDVVEFVATDHNGIIKTIMIP